MLPAAPRAAHAALAGRAFLCSRAADRNCLIGFGRALGGTSIVAVCRLCLWRARCFSFSLCDNSLSFAFRRRAGYYRELAALDDQGRWRGSRDAPGGKPDDKKRYGCDDRQEKLRFAIARRAIRTESPACPETPARPLDS
jgi:hypothetical protein